MITLFAAEAALGAAAPRPALLAAARPARAAPGGEGADSSVGGRLLQRCPRRPVPALPQDPSVLALAECAPGGAALRLAFPVPLCPALAAEADERDGGALVALDAAGRLHRIALPPPRDGAAGAPRVASVDVAAAAERALGAPTAAALAGGCACFGGARGGILCAGPPRGLPGRAPCGAVPVRLAWRLLVYLEVSSSGAGGGARGRQGLAGCVRGARLRPQATVGPERLALLCVACKTAGGSACPSSPGHLTGPSGRCACTAHGAPCRTALCLHFAVRWPRQAGRKACALCVDRPSLIASSQRR